MTVARAPLNASRNTLSWSRVFQDVHISSKLSQLLPREISPITPNSRCRTQSPQNPRQQMTHRGPYPKLKPSNPNQTLKTSPWWMHLNPPKAKTTRPKSTWKTYSMTTTQTRNLHPVRRNSNPRRNPRSQHPCTFPPHLHIILILTFSQQDNI